MQTRAQIISQIQQISDLLGLLHSASTPALRSAGCYQTGVQYLVDSRRALQQLLDSGHYVGLYGQG